MPTAVTLWSLFCLADFIFFLRTFPSPRYELQGVATFMCVVCIDAQFTSPSSLCLLQIYMHALCVQPCVCQSAQTTVLTVALVWQK